MCNCMEDTRKQLEEMAREDKRFKNLTNFRVTNEKIALVFGDDNVVRGKYYMSFIAQGKYETKSGNIRTKKENLDVMFAYCPFCGEKY